VLGEHVVLGLPGHLVDAHRRQDQHRNSTTSSPDPTRN
jgi:hypothetical protein